MKFDYFYSFFMTNLLLRIKCWQAITIELIETYKTIKSQSDHGLMKEKVISELFGVLMFLSFY